MKKNQILFNLYYPWVPSKKFSQFGPAVWPAIANIYVYNKALR